MDYRSIQMYERNKNILVEDASRSSILHGCVRRGIRFLSRFLADIEVNPLFSARIIEYPVFFQHLDLKEGKHILDFGCAEDILPIHLCSLGYKVTGFDFRPYPFSHKNFQFIQGDILTWEPKPAVFDAVVSISTVEHVGLSAYGDPLHEDGDKIAIEKLMKSLRVGGRLYLTVPAGRRCIEHIYRVYDSEGIKELVPNIELLRFFHKPGRYLDWEECSAGIIDNLVYENYYTLSPVQGMAFILAKKM